MTIFSMLWIKRDTNAGLDRDLLTVDHEWFP